MAIKRNIKDITVKSTTKNIKENSIENTPITKSNITQKQNTEKKKRTLHLNLGDDSVNSIQPEISETSDFLSITKSVDDVKNGQIEDVAKISSKTHVVDTSVNQNSPFFYEPSVFEKFSINVTTIENDTEETNSNLSDEEYDGTDVNLDTENVIETVSDVTTDLDNDEYVETVDEIVTDLDNDEYVEIVDETVTDSNNNNFDKTTDKKYKESADGINTSIQLENNIAENKIINTESPKSSIFKKFTFEDSNIIDTEGEIKNSIKHLETPAINIPNDINNIENNLNNIAPEEPTVLAEPASTIAIPDVKSDISTYNTSSDLGYDIDYSNIITDSSIDESYLYDEIVDDLISNTDLEDDLENDLEDDLENNIETAENEDTTANIDTESDETDSKIEFEDIIDNENIKTNNTENSEIEKLLKTFNQTISTLSDRITNLEAQKQDSIDENNNVSNSNFETNQNTKNELLEELLSYLENDSSENDLDSTPLDLSKEPSFDEVLEEDTTSVEEPILNEVSEESFEENTTSVEEPASDEFNKETFEENTICEEEPILDEVNDETLDLASFDHMFEEDDNSKSEDNILEDVLLENIYEEDLKKISEDDILETIDINTGTVTNNEPISDFFTIIDSLSKTISELENSPDIKNGNTEENTKNEKSINILVNKDDIFSISLLNETYEIVANFDNISVISDNLHISTPKSNFSVQLNDNKYIEIHNKENYFTVDTNLEDIEFSNTMNNLSLSKNILQLDIEESFKISSVDNKIELSIIDSKIEEPNSTNKIDENSISDNNTLLISEETQKVYLPYTIEEVMIKLEENNKYQTAKEVIEKEYTLPLSTFRSPIISRFKEAYRLMRVKEKSSVYAAIDFGLELMFNSNLNPAIIRASKNLIELNKYLNCLYDNEVDKFDSFKIVYKILPKIK